MEYILQEAVHQGKAIKAHAGGGKLDFTDIFKVDKSTFKRLHNALGAGTQIAIEKLRDNIFQDGMKAILLKAVFSSNSKVIVQPYNLVSLLYMLLVLETSC